MGGDAFGTGGFCFQGGVHGFCRSNTYIPFNILVRISKYVYSLL